MNAIEKAKVLRENGYVDYQYQYLHFWNKVGYGIVAEGETKAIAAKEAYQHYLDSLTQESESALVEIPDMLAEKNERIAKLEADLAAAQAIIVDAGKQVESLKMQVEKYAQMNIDLSQANVDLKNENAKLINIIENAHTDLQNGDAKLAYKLLTKFFVDREEKQAPQETGVTLDAAKYAIGQTVIITSHLDKIRGEVTQRFQGQYLVKQSNGLDVWRWENELEPLAQEASEIVPSEVTLSEAEIEWLGRMYVPMSSDFRAYVFSQEAKSAPFCVVRMGETKNGMLRYQLTPEKRTDANMKAIEAKRKELLGES